MREFFSWFRKCSDCNGRRNKHYLDCVIWDEFYENRKSNG